MRAHYCTNRTTQMNTKDHPIQSLPAMLDNFSAYSLSFVVKQCETDRWSKLRKRRDEDRVPVNIIDVDDA